MEKNKFITENLLKLMYQLQLFLILYCIALYFMVNDYRSSINGGGFHPLWLGSLFVLTVIYTLLGTVLKNWKLTALCYLTVCFLVFFLYPFKPYNIIAALLAFTMAIGAFVQMVHKTYRINPFPLGFVVVILGLKISDIKNMNKGFNFVSVQRIFLLAALFFIVFYVVNLYISNTYAYMKMNNAYNYGLQNQVLMTENISVLIIIVVAVIVIAGVILIARTGIFDRMDVIIFKVLAILLSPIGYMLNGSSVSKKELDAVDFSKIDTSRLKVGRGVEVPGYLISLFFLCILAVVIIFIIKKLKELFTTKIKFENEEIEIEVSRNTDFISEKIKKMVTPKFDNDNNSEIRKEYFKFINTQDKRELSRQQTAREMTTIVGKNKKNRNINKDKLTGIYEKARYSNENCSNRDVEEIKITINGK